MPTYDFKCLKCGKVFEKMLPITHKENPTCLGCGYHSTQKLLSAPQVIFKCGGFYKTDNRKPEKKPVKSKCTTDSDKKDIKDIKDTKDTKNTKDSKDTSKKKNINTKNNE